MKTYSEKVLHQLWELINKYQSGGTVNPKPGTPEYQTALAKSQGEIKQDNSLWGKLQRFEVKHPMMSTISEIVPVAGSIIRAIKADTPTERTKAILETGLDMGLSILGTSFGSVSNKLFKEASRHSDNAVRYANKAREYADKLSNFQIPQTKSELEKIPYLYNQIKPHVKVYNPDHNYKILKQPIDRSGITILQKYVDDNLSALQRNKEYYEGLEWLSNLKADAKARAAQKGAFSSALIFGTALEKPNK